MLVVIIFFVVMWVIFFSNLGLLVVFKLILWGNKVVLMILLWLCIVFVFYMVGIVELLRLLLIDVW